MPNEPLDRLLGELPRETAGPFFTARVLARLDLPAKRRGSRALARLRPFALPAAAALGLAAFLALTTLGPEPEWSPARGASSTPAELANRDEARRLLAEIRAEHGRLTTELAALRDERPEGLDGDQPPVVYLGGDEKMDLMVDLARVRDLPAGPVQPAGYRRP